MGLLFVVFGEAIVRGFTPDPAVVAYGSSALRIISAGFLFYAVGMVVTQAFNGAGDTWTPTLINLFGFWLWETPLAWVLARPLGRGPQGVFIAVLLAFSGTAIAGVILFRRGRWKRVRV